MADFPYKKPIFNSSQVHYVIFQLMGMQQMQDIRILKSSP